MTNRKQDRRGSPGIWIAGLLAATWAAGAQGGSLVIPNFSFEEPVVPPVAPYASPEIGEWQKSPQPAWYDPAMNQDTPWEFLSGQFYNVPFPGQFIQNADGAQAAFIFAVPEVALLQDYDSVSGTNEMPGHGFDAVFTPGSAYKLSAGVIGGAGGMMPGATLELGLYYRDASNNIVTVAATAITNSPDLFPTNTVFVDFNATLPAVRAEDPWARKHIGVRLLSTTDFTKAGGYWDVDNVRLIETPPGPRLSEASIIGGEFVFKLASEPGERVEVLSSVNPANPLPDWNRAGIFTNTTGILSITNNTGQSARRFYRARQL